MWQGKWNTNPAQPFKHSWIHYRIFMKFQNCPSLAYLFLDFLQGQRGRNCDFHGFVSTARSITPTNRNWFGSWATITIGRMRRAGFTIYISVTHFMTGSFIVAHGFAFRRLFVARHHQRHAFIGWNAFRPVRLTGSSDFGSTRTAVAAGYVAVAENITVQSTRGVVFSADVATRTTINILVTINAVVIIVFFSFRRNILQNRRKQQQTLINYSKNWEAHLTIFQRN